MYQPDPFQKLEQKIYDLARDGSCLQGDIEELQHQLIEARRCQRRLADSVDNIRFTVGLLVLAVFLVPLARWLWSWF